MEFLTCKSIPALSKFQICGNFGFLDFQISDAQPEIQMQLIRIKDRYKHVFFTLVVLISCHFLCFLFLFPDNS
jgi:hypothetical protein